MLIEVRPRHVAAVMMAAGWMMVAQTRIKDDQTSFTKISTSNGPSRFYLSQGPAPADATDVDARGKIQAFDAVLYVDQDGKLKIKKSDGTVVSLEP